MKAASPLVLLSTGVIAALSFVTMAGPKYSEGYRAGIINKFAVEKQWLVTKTGEGEMLMGKDSSILTKTSTTTTTDTDGNVTTSTTTTKINPWQFSTSTKDAADFEKQMGNPIVIHYKSEVNGLFMKSDTAYQALDIEAIRPEAKLTSICSDEAANGKWSVGKRIGRVVKLSRSGFTSKSYEMMMQEGDSGNVFTEMTIKSQAMYDCALTALKSSQKVVIEYRELGVYNALARDSAYSVYKIYSAEK